MANTARGEIMSNALIDLLFCIGGLAVAVAMDPERMCL